jgi:asparagine synthase (glutamine-hydrolysing)
MPLGSAVLSDLVMSAIAGHFGEGDRDLLLGFARLMRHRGEGGSIAHTHPENRLGLTCLGDRGRPPHIASSGGASCVFAGTLLNDAALARRFGLERGAEAAAIVLAGWREERERVFDRLDGPFTVAIGDERELFVARDALGERALYYTVIGQTVLFASEIKAFLAHPRFVVKPDLGSLNRLMVFSFIPGRESMFDGVFEVPPGSYLALRRGRPPAVEPYWVLREGSDPGEATAATTEAAATRELERLVTLATKKRLRGAKKVAAFLSGGIDSSAVVAIVAGLGAEVTAFSASFGHGQPNELMYARLVAQHCRVEHRVVDIEPDQFLDLLPAIMWSLDDPLCDCITVPNYILAREAAKEAELVFNGEGGDPLFGGPKNKFLILGEWYSFLGGYDRASAYLSSYHKFYDYLDDLFTPEFLATTGGREPLLDLVRPYLEDADISHFLNRLMHVNIKLKGGQNILVKVDKMLSANGVLPASPLFDKALAEFSFAIPPRLKRKGDVEKYVFKKAMEGKLPRPVVYRKKVGMGVPLNHWFRVTKLRDYTLDHLNSARARARGYFRPDFIDGLAGGRRADTDIGKDRMGELLWMLLAVELWHRVYVDGDLRPEVA